MDSEIPKVNFVYSVQNFIIYIQPPKFTDNNHEFHMVNSVCWQTIVCLTCSLVATALLLIFPLSTHQVWLTCLGCSIVASVLLLIFPLSTHQVLLICLTCSFCANAFLLIFPLSTHQVWLICLTCCLVACVLLLIFLFQHIKCDSHVFHVPSIPVFFSWSFLF